jgi:type I restriction enzyme S subunit
MTTSRVIRSALERKLPEGWRWVRLGEVIAEAQGGFASGERSADGVIQLRMNNVTTRATFDWSTVLRVPSDEPTRRKYSLRPGDVLFNNTNSTELVGKTALFPGHSEPVVYSNHFIRLRAAQEKLDPRFLALWLRSQWQQKVFAAICNQWVGQAAVQRDKLL